MAKKTTYKWKWQNYRDDRLDRWHVEPAATIRGDTLSQQRKDKVTPIVEPEATRPAATRAGGTLSETEIMPLCEQRKDKVAPAATTPDGTFRRLYNQAMWAYNSDSLHYKIAISTTHSVPF